jgi:hypothetical protein
MRKSSGRPTDALIETLVSSPLILGPRMSTCAGHSRHPQQGQDEAVADDADLVHLAARRSGGQVNKAADTKPRITRAHRLPFLLNGLPNVRYCTGKVDRVPSNSRGELKIVDMA